MHCCSNCFADTEIKAIIEGSKTKGNCDFCGSEGVGLYKIEEEHILSELFDGLLDTYTPISELPNNYPREHTDLLKNILCHDWNIFNVSPDKAYKIIVSICNDRYNDQPELFDGPVGIRQIEDIDYLENNSVLKTFAWSDFVDGIKRKNRFHSNYINKEMLSIFLNCIIKIHKKSETFWRSRICSSTSGFTTEEMGPPPLGKAKGGRVNPAGISLLYLSDLKDTTLYEIRAGIYDYVSVGHFVLNKDIEVIDLAAIDKVSPFVGIERGFDFTQYAINIGHLKMIANEIAKPLRNDDELEYLPTQYISDYVKSIGYDGIEYESTMGTGGKNLAIFDDSFFECTDVEVLDIKSINYKYIPVCN